MTIDELNRFREKIAELGLEEKEVAEKIEAAARAEMIDRGWEAPYRYWGLGGITRGDASDEDLKADAEGHGLPFNPDDISNITEAYESEFEELLWQKLNEMRVKKD
jgi:hypothetical protein